ncbi:MAG TPA: response regulator [Nitrososphaeraceae archaeon]|nr:response regulator [Nitrososphaeraceae archaeon]
MFQSNGKRILIIEDDVDINNLFKLYLEDYGYIIDAFTDPIDALYSFKKNTYDLVLLDLKMPKMNGILLYEKLHSIDPDLVFRFITADREYVEHLKNSFRDIEKFVIYKPIHLSELGKKIHFLLLVNNHSNQQQQNKNQLLTML